jgi:asparagine synthase (glutamine-hydrolysing)
MCGIAGILVRADSTADGEFTPRVESMADQMAHRGPDDSGTVVAAPAEGWRLYLGHRRLSILDVSRNGHQPMGDPSTGSWITYNGEIYNHRDLRSTLRRDDFQSNSDTESLLHAWVEKGPEVIEELRGIFAFALHDGQRDQLWLVRDRLGVKPLYISMPSPDLMLFASEVRALLASGLVARRLSTEGLSSYLAFGAIQAPYTIVECVQSLLPGERVRVEIARSGLVLHRERYWRPGFLASGSADADQPGGVNPTARNRADLVDALRPAFDEAVSSRFLSDVPIGVFLSGGIDSSAIVASASRQQLQPATFSIAFAEAQFDESAHARAVAQACGSHHTELTVTSQTMLADLDKALGCYDQPSSDGLNTYTISKAAHEAGLKVAISGLGGDEVFAGYSTFRRLPAIEKWVRRCGVRGGVGLRSVGGSLFYRSERLWRALQLLGFSRSRLDIYRVLRQFYSAERIARLLEGDGALAMSLPARLANELSAAAEATDSVNSVSLLELSLYMHNVLLRDTDQMSMAHGLEVRVPLLDHSLVEKLARLPGEVKMPSGSQPSKWLLAEMVNELLPAEVVHRRKMGFVFPWNRWLRGELAEYVEEHLLNHSAVRAAGLAPREVGKLWQTYRRRGTGLRYPEVLALLNLVHWCQANRVSAA